MSYTEIFGFDRNGDAYLQDEVTNAWRRAMSIWSILEERYLPQYRPSFIPKHIENKDIEKVLGYKPSRTSCIFDNKAMKEIWNLADDERLKSNEKIALATTFDYVIIKKENFEQLIKAFREFEGNTSLKEQADIIEKMLNDENCIALGFNQTSVNGDNWTNLGGYNEETEEQIPYNLFTGDKHWFLFES